MAAAFHARFDRPAPPTLGRAVHGGDRRNCTGAISRVRALPGTRHRCDRGGRGRPRRRPGRRAWTDIGRLGGGPSRPPAPGSSAAPGASCDPDRASSARVGMSRPSRSSRSRTPWRSATPAWTTASWRSWAGSHRRHRSVRTGADSPAGAERRSARSSCVCPEEIDVADAGARIAGPRDRRSNGRDASPQGPALNPDLDELDTSWRPDLISAPASMASQRRPTSFSSATSTTGVPPSARRPRSTPAGIGSSWTRSRASRAVAASAQRGARRGADVIDRATSRPIIATEAPSSPILSMVVTAGGPKDLRRDRAVARHRRAEASSIQRVLWIVRVLEDRTGHRRTSSSTAPTRSTR